jgi:riboflavin kinase / FMN adenylyltransferase
MAVVGMRYQESPPAPFRGGVVAIGNFDGVHRGHASLIAAATQIARPENRPVVAVTFDPHPLVLLARERYQPPLTTIEARAAQLQQIGADHVVVLQTAPELLALSAEYFFETIVDQALEASGVVEGFNFRFGRDRAGSNATLKQMCSARGMTFQEVPPYALDGVPVSSSRVRDAVQTGDIAQATNLLGREYAIAGTVIAGAKRGRTIGFPTANLDDVATLLPGEGVYAVRVRWNGRTYAGAANIGPNPTFGEQARKIEIHLLDFDGDIYGETLSVGFVARLRQTQKFADVAALVDQMTRDMAAARDRIGQEPS